MRKKLLFAGSLIAIVSAGALLWIVSSHSPANNTPSDNTPKKTAAAIKEEKLACIADLPLNVRIGQKLMAAGYASEMPDELAAFRAGFIGGIILMDEVSADQISEFRAAMTIPPLVAVDQEGGSVQRYKSSGTLPGAEHMAASDSSDAAYKQYLANNIYLKNHGISVNFAPVVDVASRTPNPLPGRMYSTDPSVVTAYASASIRAAKTAGLTPVIKHFPGMGSATGNTDFESATTDPLAVLKTRDLVPYQKLASLQPDVMVGNMIVPDLTDGQPAIWSPQAISLLRDIGYQNSVVYSDSLTADAIPGSVADAALKSWLAGIDIALIVQADTETQNLTNYFDDIIQQAITAAQQETFDINTFDESVLRIFNRKQVDPCSLNTTLTLKTPGHRPTVTG